MNLIPISDNVLINPESISCIEQRTSRGIEVTYVWIGDKNYVLEIPLVDFYKSLGIVEQNQHNQFWAG